MGMHFLSKPARFATAAPIAPFPKTLENMQGATSKLQQRVQQITVELLNKDKQVWEKDRKIHEHTINACSCDESVGCRSGTKAVLEQCAAKPMILYCNSWIGALFL